MKKIVLILLCAIALTNVSYGQAKTTKSLTLEAEIIALENAGWEAWKNKDVKWYQKNTTEEFLNINSDGVSDKSQIIKATQTDCDVKSFSLENFSFVHLDESCVLLTFLSTQDGMCNGKKLSRKVRASVNYVKRGEKWMETFYMETPVVE